MNGNLDQVAVNHIEHTHSKMEILALTMFNIFLLSTDGGKQSSRQLHFYSKEHFNHMKQVAYTGYSL